MDNSKKIVDNLWITFLACSEKKKVIHSPRSKIVDNSPQIVDNFIEIVDNLWITFRFLWITFRLSELSTGLSTGSQLLFDDFKGIS